MNEFLLIAFLLVSVEAKGTQVGLRTLPSFYPPPVKKSQKSLPSDGKREVWHDYFHREWPETDACSGRGLRCDTGIPLPGAASRPGRQLTARWRPSDA